MLSNFPKINNHLRLSVKTYNYKKTTDIITLSPGSCQCLDESPIRNLPFCWISTLRPLPETQLRQKKFRKTKNKRICGFTVLLKFTYSDMPLVKKPGGGVASCSGCRWWESQRQQGSYNLWMIIFLFLPMQTEKHNWGRYLLNNRTGHLRRHGQNPCSYAVK